MNNTEVEKSNFPNLTDLSKEIQDINQNAVLYNGLDAIKEANESISYNSDVNLLNDDCLIHIFQCLPIIDRIKIERVCSRWKSVSEISWFDLQTFSISCKNQVFKASNKSNDVNYIVLQIISRCSTFLKAVSINTYKMDFELSKIISFLAENCNNIDTLILQHYYNEEVKNNIEGQPCELEDQLINLFKNNTGLRILDFEGLIIKGKCFETLPKYSLKILFLKDCDYIEKKYIKTFLCHLKNLEIMKIDCCGEEIIETVIDELTKSECSLKELTLLEFERNVLNNYKLPELFLKQRKLQTVALNHFEITKEMLSSLPYESVEELCMTDCNVSSEDLMNSLPQFKKLNALTIDMNKIDNLHLQAISSCVNLKILNLSDIQSSLLTSVGEYHFSKLKNLEELYVNSNEFVTDNFLNAVAQCKKLFFLDIHNCKNISNKGLGHLESIPKLQVLDISGIQSVTDEPLKNFKSLEHLMCCACNSIKNSGLSDLINNAKNLSILDITGCKNITNEFIKDIIKIKENIENSIALTIIIRNSGIVINEISSLPMSIKVISEFICEHCSSHY